MKLRITQICFFMMLITMATHSALGCDLARDTRRVAWHKQSEFRKEKSTKACFGIALDVYNRMNAISFEGLNKKSFHCAAMSRYYYSKSINKMVEYAKNNNNDTLLRNVRYLVTSAKINMLKSKAKMNFDGNICYSNKSKIMSLLYDISTLNKMFQKSEFSIEPINIDSAINFGKLTLLLEYEYALTILQYEVGNASFQLFQNDCCEKLQEECSEQLRNKSLNMYKNSQEILEKLSAMPIKWDGYTQFTTTQEIQNQLNLLKQGILNVENNSLQ